MTHVGWMGIIDGVNIQFFPNQALKLGYIQDTYFNNCSFISSGSKDNPAVTCFTDANYVYFSKCHFEVERSVGDDIQMMIAMCMNQPALILALHIVSSLQIIHGYRWMLAILLTNLVLVNLTYNILCLEKELTFLS